MNEVYIASFELDIQEIMQAVDQEQLLNYSDAAQVVRFQLVGSGAGLIDQEQIQYKGLSATAQDYCYYCTRLCTATAMGQRRTSITCLFT